MSGRGGADGLAPLSPRTPAAQARMREEVARLREEAGCVPGLGVLIVGDRKDSQIYVARKVRARARGAMRGRTTPPGSRAF